MRFSWIGKSRFVSLAFPFQFSEAMSFKRLRMLRGRLKLDSSASTCIVVSLEACACCIENSWQHKDIEYIHDKIGRALISVRKFRNTLEERIELTVDLEQLGENKWITLWTISLVQAVCSKKWIIGIPLLWHSVCTAQGFRHAQISEIWKDLFQPSLTSTSKKYRQQRYRFPIRVSKHE